MLKEKRKIAAKTSLKSHAVATTHFTNGASGAQLRHKTSGQLQTCASGATCMRGVSSFVCFLCVYDNELCIDNNVIIVYEQNGKVRCAILCCFYSHSSGTQVRHIVLFLFTVAEHIHPQLVSRGNTA